MCCTRTAGGGHSEGLRATQGLPSSSTLVQLLGMISTLAQVCHIPRPCRQQHRMTVRSAAQAPAAQAGAVGSEPGLGRRLTAADSKELEQLWEGVTTVVLDCDGVLWRGMQLLPGTVEALQRFRRRGLRLLFLTNNSSKSRRQYLRKFRSLGIEAAPEEVVPTSYAAAAYLRSIGFAKRALVLGTEGMGHEMQEAGIDYCTWEQLCSSGGSGGSRDGSGGGSTDAEAAYASCSSGSELAELERAWTADGFGGLRLDPDIGAVVVGWDPTFSYGKLCLASALLLELPGCHFVATNLDSADNMGNGRMMPGTGCIVRSIETATDRLAFNVGKGGPWLLPFLCEQYGLRPEQALIVGDRLDTDIALGRAGGLKTVLPMTGVTTEAALAAAAEGEVPHCGAKPGGAGGHPLGLAQRGVVVGPSATACCASLDDSALEHRARCTGLSTRCTCPCSSWLNPRAMYWHS
ncbi:hypothetical protein ABPG75_008021 [Micractinium tetrahymenae]